MSGCIPWAGFVPRTVVALPASDLAAPPRELAAWEAESKQVPGYWRYGDRGERSVATELRLREDGGAIVLSRNAVRFLDAAGELEGARRFAHSYVSAALFRAADGLWVAGLLGAEEERELHAFPLESPLEAPSGESRPRHAWKCPQCFGLVAADFSGDGVDSLVVGNRQEWEVELPWWLYNYKPRYATGLLIFQPSSGARRLVKARHDATRIAALDLEGDGREEVILHPFTGASAGYLYWTERISVLRGDGRLATTVRCGELARGDL